MKGEVNFPNLYFLPKKIDFGYVPLSANAYKEIYIVNISPMTVSYQIYWNSTSSRIMKVYSESNLTEEQESVEESHDTEQYEEFIKTYDELITYETKVVTYEYYSSIFFLILFYLKIFCVSPFSLLRQSQIDQRPQRHFC